MVIVLPGGPDVILNAITWSVSTRTRNGRLAACLKLLASSSFLFRSHLACASQSFLLPADTDYITGNTYGALEEMVRARWSLTGFAVCAVGTYICNLQSVQNPAVWVIVDSSIISGSTPCCRS